MSSARPFLDFLREHRNGATHDELSDALQELVSAVAEEGKAGKLTLTIAIKPSDVGEGAVTVLDEIKLAPPKRTKGASIFYVSPENNLVRQDPRQPSLELREVPPASVAKALA